MSFCEYDQKGEPYSQLTGNMTRKGSHIHPYRKECDLHGGINKPQCTRIVMRLTWGKYVNPNARFYSGGLVSDLATMNVEYIAENAEL